VALVNGYKNNRSIALGRLLFYDGNYNLHDGQEDHPLFVVVHKNIASFIFSVEKNREATSLDIR